MEVCPIPSNSDIAGVGIRVATYMQSCTAFIVTLLAITYRFMDLLSKLSKEDGDIPIAPSLRRFNVSSLLSDLRSTLVGLRNGLSVASTSVLISAIVLAYSEEGLTVYHGLVTLNLAQLNSLSSLFVWLVVAFTSESPEMDILTVMAEDLADSDTASTTSRDSNANSMTSTSRSAAFGIVIKNFFIRGLRGSIHFVVHASLAGGFGLWFWSNQSHFERYAEGSDCIAQTWYWFFVPLNSHNKRIRDFFLAYNSLLVFPVTAPIAATLLSVAVGIAVTLPLFPLTIWSMTAPPPWPTVITVFCLGGLGGAAYILPLAFYIYSTEQTIRLNAGSLEGDSEGSWSYGQTLALITALMSLGMLAWDLAKLVRLLLKGPAKSDIEAKGEDQNVEKPQEILPISSAVSLRESGSSIRRTNTDASHERPGTEQVNERTSTDPAHNKTNSPSTT